ncbi:histidinol-phosphate aminotransferase [Desulfohalotomaculum tongense]|uniref:histidinol-phosphate transaminase n=1 Tax=Desulforadius tongensis TaxID=1216062 RepID=UPI0019579189|nr:histidinol-phosphate transaminase [Desulforadius tongensis]MBM7854264.1 histidinol-phosphate aminotransferase [Desulforadius tongensis]
MREDFNPALLMREDLRDLKPYQPHDYPNTIKLDANENPYPFPPRALKELNDLLSDVNFPRYPDPAAVELRRSIAGYAGVRPGQVMVGNGSDELIFYLALAFGSGGKVAIASPTFSMYRIHSRIAGADPVEIPRERDFSINPRAMVKAVQAAGARMLVLCSPNNPTGNAIPLETVEEILAGTSGLVVVDQAYLEFGGADCVPLLEKYPHLVILRTFSKAFGLAGLRVGYMLAGEPLINELLRIKQPYNLNSFSQRAAWVALKYLPVFKEQWKQIISQRDYIKEELSQMPGIRVYPSDANYILFHTEMGAGVLHNKLLEKRILIRNLGKDMPGYLRVNAGTREESEAFIQAMSAITNGVK